ncbi:MAG: phage portal protein [Marinilabiliaceae bacterium]|nr:phage portal protein [Marinilabiliaceae bacterium]
MDIQELNEMLQADNSLGVVAELKNGRNKPLPNIETINKQMEPEMHNVMNPSLRPDKRIVVDKEQVGDDVIGLYQESGTMTRIEKVNRIALALQKLIAKRAASFCFGNDITISCDAKEGTAEADVLKSVLKIMKKAKTRSINRRIAKEIFSSTEAAELWYVVKHPTNKYGFESQYTIRCRELLPSKGYTLYPYFDDYGDMIAFSYEYHTTDMNQIKHKFFETYTDTARYRWSMDDNNEWGLEEGFPKVNPLGKIPVVYGCQDEPEWADVQWMIDRLETLLSNFGDTNDYHGAPKIVVKGQINGWAKKGESGDVLEIDNDGDISYLSWQQAPESVRLEIDTLLRMIYTITQTPDISFDAMRGIGQVSGTALKLLFMDAHLKVVDKGDIFDDYLPRRLSIVTDLTKMVNTSDVAFQEACDTIEIDAYITPYMIDDDRSKVDLALAANGGKTVMSRRTSIQYCGMVDDVDQEMQRIDEEENGSFAPVQDIVEPTI